MHSCRSQRWFAAALLLIGCANASYAQFPGAPNLPGGMAVPGSPEAMTMGEVLLTAPPGTLKTMLSLDTQQVRKIMAIQQQTVQQWRAASLQEMRDMQPGQFDPAQSNAKRNHQNAGLMSAVRAVLTPQQRQALPRVLMEIQVATMAGIPPEVVGNLWLTDAQQRRIEKIVRSDRQQLVEKERRIPPNSRIGGIEFRTMASDMRRIQAHTFHQSLMALTPKQQYRVTHYLQLHAADVGPDGFKLGPPGFMIGPPQISDGPTITTTITIQEP